MKRFLLVMIAVILICHSVYSEDKTYSVQFDTTGYSPFKLEFGFRTVDGKPLSSDNYSFEFGELSENGESWSASFVFQVYWSITSEKPITLLLGFSDESDPQLVNEENPEDKTEWILTWGGDKTLDSSGNNLREVVYDHNGGTTENVNGLTNVTAMVTFSSDESKSALEKFSLGRYLGSISVTVMDEG